MSIIYHLNLTWSDDECVEIMSFGVCVPAQLFWERKLIGLNAFDIADELVKTMDLPKGLQGADKPDKHDGHVYD